ncbi:MAG: anti-sigma regulatory factor [Desulfococcaceae bacterium]|jgi:serine/threonine-protein kinase RsbT|nr:anti-sigma regulatory factor [Desulfococcaceae bacterium]
MKQTDTYSVAVSKEIHVSQARQLGVKIAESLGFGKADCCIISTSVSELANNLIIHTFRGGSIFFRVLEKDDKKGIEIIAEDTGPGIRDIDLSMRDGYSTCGGLGSGLGGVKRLMHEFEITSEYGKGTCITARKWR